MLQERNVPFFIIFLLSDAGNVFDLDTEFELESRIEAGRVDDLVGIVEPASIGDEVRSARINLRDAF